MVTILAFSDIEDLHLAITTLGEGVVARPLPSIHIGGQTAWEEVPLVHWEVTSGEPALCYYGADPDADDETSARIIWRARRGYGVRLRDSGWAIVVVDADDEMYEEAVGLVEFARPGTL